MTHFSKKHNILHGTAFLQTLDMCLLTFHHFSMCIQQIILNEILLHYSAKRWIEILQQAVPVFLADEMSK